ncbi:IclR family transcriptional regulator [Dactylosporangium sucinum]|uniref:HTH-type transcriptional regulator YagI n=1 Tax=Dactylosporangium sucinum TaxID=1424081 RepID=A0A917U703_9ACTN|nr:IclR family transcriptional regulator [Dactylosporangium sucinum]GGM61864.1 putative HTH-type transcriptional regulator YagI [Dactylosporangium sucinum]
MSGLQNATRVVQLIELLAARKAISLDDAAAELGVHKSNALRLLATLRELGWVTSNNSRTEYHLGHRLIAIGQSAVSGDTLQQVLKIAAEVCDLTGETVHVSVPTGTHMITVGRIDSPNSLRVTRDIGHEDTLHATAVGKVYLAWLPEDEAAALLSRIPLSRLTPKTLTSKSAILKELKTIRETGYAVNLEETEIGVTALAVLLQVLPHTTPFALSLTGPSSRWSHTEIDKALPEILTIVGPFRAKPQ